MESLDNLNPIQNDIASADGRPVSDRENAYLSEAEQIANAVIAELETDDYSGVNQRLGNMIPEAKEKNEYVFEHPGIVSTFAAAAVCSVLSLIFLYLLFIGAATAFLSIKYLWHGIIIAAVSFVFLLMDICLIVRLVAVIMREIRYDIYRELLGFKNYKFIEDLAICSKQKETTVIKDLQHAIKQKLIPQGHFSNENLVFMVSDVVYDRYMEKPAVYDRYFRQEIDERKRAKARTERISQIMETGEQYIKKLNGYRTLIKNKKMAKKIEHMENVGSMIFHEIDVNPSQANSLGVFLNYYLPTTEKLLDAYISITEKKVSVPNLTEARIEIEEIIDKSIIAFESILEKLYEEYEMDIASDISAMEMVMSKEGLFC